MTRSLLAMGMMALLTLTGAGTAQAGVNDPDDLMSACYAVWEDVTPYSMGIEVCPPAG